MKHPVWGSTVTRIYDGRSGVQILAGAKDLSVLQNIRPAPPPTQPPTPALSLPVKWPLQTVCPFPSVFSQVYKPVELYLHSNCRLLWHILVQFYFTSYLCTYLFKRSCLTGLIEEPFYTLLTPYMHTTWPIYFIFIVPITLTLWTAQLTNLITLFPSVINSLYRSDCLLIILFPPKFFNTHNSFNLKIHISHT